MKVYQNKEQLKEDVDFMKSILEYDPDYRNHIINVLFTQWMDTSPDSPWYYDGSEEEIEAADTLVSINEIESNEEEPSTTVKIDENGKSNEWSGEHTVFHEVEEESGKRKNKFYNLRYL
tara:strand:- start:595 stop:951 length:357 start_codon:yes stop_codon:yes gene_type:complete